MNKRMSKVEVKFEDRTFEMYVDCEKPDFALDYISSMLRLFAEIRSVGVKACLSNISVETEQ